MCYKLSLISCVMSVAYYMLGMCVVVCFFFFFQAEDGIRDLVRSRGLGDVYKRQVYGTLKGEVVSEDHPTDPLCSYGITKLTIEKYLQLYRELYGVSSVVLRIANPYGPGQRPDSIQGVILSLIHI